MKLLKDRDDAAVDITKQLTNQMIVKISELIQMRDELVKNKKRKMNMIERKFKKDLFGIERDIYNFENAIKKVVGVKGYKKLRKEHIQSLEQKKEEVKETQKLTNKKNDEVKENGKTEM